MSLEVLKTRNAEIFDTAKPKTIDRIGSTKRSTRERALSLLIEPLNQDLSDDITVIQTLPLEFLLRGDLLGAVWYVETLGKMGNPVSLEVLRQVMKSSIQERKELLERKNEIDLKVLDSGMGSLFRMLNGHNEYKEHPEILLLEGQLYESRGEYRKALERYNKLIELGNEEGYKAGAGVYELMNQPVFARELLESAYEIYQNSGIVPDIIRISSKLGERDKVIRWYNILVSTDPEGTFPLVIYKGTVENDEELEVVEEVIAAYITYGGFVPSESLATVSHQTTLYVAEGVGKENDVIEKLGGKDPKKWSKEENAIFISSFFRRLKLMQFDIFTLGNGRYVEYYLRDIEGFGFSTSQTQRGALGVFFLENFSVEVDHEAKKRTTEEEKKLDQSLESTHKPFNTLYENISLHVGRIGELFFQPNFLDLQEKYVVPLLRNAAIQEGEYDQEMEDEMESSVAPLRDELHYYDSLRPSLRKNYEDFIGQIDQKYGTFYRRHLQVLAKNPQVKADTYPQSLKEYPDIALLFWVEKILSGQFPTEEPEEIEEIVQGYGLSKLGTQDTLLFGSLMIDISPAYTISFLALQPELLYIPEAIYVITDALRLLEPRERKASIHDLHKIAREDYGARGFFEHISVLFGDILDDNPTDEESENMLLARGNMAILQRKGIETALLNFQIAGEEYSSIEGLLQAGDSYEDANNYEKALFFFEQAFLQEDSIRVVTKILNCAIIAGLYDKAKEYIQFAHTKGYQVPNYIIAYYLWQGKSELAFLQLILMIRNKQELIDMPVGTLKLLVSTINSVIRMKEEDAKSQPGLSRLKVYVSFILSNVSFNNVPIPAETWMHHWNYCLEHISLYANQDGLGEIEKTFIPLTGEIDDVDMSEKSITERCVEYIDTYATNIIMTLELIAREEKDVEKQQKILAVMNNLRGQVVVLLKIFPDSEGMVNGWLNELTFMNGGKYMFSEADKKYPIHTIN